MTSRDHQSTEPTELDDGFWDLYRVNGCTYTFSPPRSSAEAFEDALEDLLRSRDKIVRHVGSLASSRRPDEPGDGKATIEPGDA